MKRFQKMFVAVALSMTMTVSLFAGCGNKKSDKDQDGKTIVSVGEWPTKGTGVQNMADRKQRFENANPEFTIVPDEWTYELKTFYAKAAGGQLPTVYRVFFTEMSQIIDAGYAADITDVLKKHDIYDKFNKEVLNIVSRDGKAYAFPFSTYALGLACNIELMEKAGLVEADGTPKQPKDWEELRMFAVKIKEATGKPGFVFPTANNNGGWMFTPLAWSYGVEFMKKDGDKWKATFDTPEAVAALQYIKDLKWKYDVLPSNTLIDGTEYYKIFGTGNAGMMIAAGSISNSLSQYDFDINKIGMVAIPKGPQKHITLMGGGVYAISGNSTEKQIDGALKWTEMAYTPFMSNEFKENVKTTVDKRLADGILVGVKELNIWNSEVETVKYKDEYEREHANINLNHVKLYNEFIEDLGDCELRPEEPVCAQELYGILDRCIQEVLVNKDADCASLIKKANSDFQVNYLDNVDY